MYKRSLTKQLRLAAKQYPVVTIMGPRQSGKTTLVTATFPRKAYVNLEDPDIRAFAENDPREFLDQFPHGAILDEIQRAPHLLSYIQVIVDKTKQHGRYILTGSHQLELHHAVSQSLAGRTAILTLLPLSLVELHQAKINLPIDDLLLKGFMPRVYADKLNPTQAYRNYLQTYIERDVRQMHNVRDLKAFQNFIKICASRIGTTLNRESIGNDLGLTGKTINEWLSVLEASYILFTLPPYFENFGKRIIKAPKLYFTDVGLATYLLGIETIEQVKRDPLRGFLIENLVILELLKARLNKGLEPQLYFYRDNHQNEVDVIYKQANTLIPIEVKATKTFSTSLLSNLKYYQNLVGERAKQAYLIYTGDIEQKVGKVKVINFASTAKIVEEK